MQALDGWLKAVHADGLVLMRTRVAGPWGYAVEPSDAVVFHFVAEGRAFVRHPACTWDRNNPWLLRQEPWECDLSKRCLLFFSKLLNQINNRLLFADRNPTTSMNQLFFRYWMPC